MSYFYNSTEELGTIVTASNTSCFCIPNKCQIMTRQTFLLWWRVDLELSDEGKDLKKRGARWWSPVRWLSLPLEPPFLGWDDDMWECNSGIVGSCLPGSPYSAKWEPEDNLVILTCLYWKCWFLEHFGNFEPLSRKADRTFTYWKDQILYRYFGIKYYTGILGIIRAILQTTKLTFWDGSRVGWVSGAHVAFDQ